MWSSSVGESPTESYQQDEFWDWCLSKCITKEQADDMIYDMSYDHDYDYDIGEHALR